jgi:hypothetical protein
VPVWKLAVPTTVAEEIDALRGADAESALIYPPPGRALSNACAHTEHNGEGFQKRHPLVAQAIGALSGSRSVTNT